MLSQAQRTTILELNAQQVSKREIARVLGISRLAVRKVLRSNSGTVVELERRTLRTARREIPNTRAISRLLTCCAFSSRIVVRCAWLNMGFLLRLDFFVDAMELLLNARDLMPRGFGLLGIQLGGSCGRQSPLCAVHNRHHHFQIAQQFGAGPGWSFLL